MSTAMSLEATVKTNLHSTQEERHGVRKAERVRKTGRCVFDYATRTELMDMMRARGYTDEQINEALTAR